MSVLHEILCLYLQQGKALQGKFHHLLLPSVKLYACVTVGVCGFDCSSVRLIGRPSNHDYSLSDVYFIGILSAKQGISCGLTLPQSGYERSVVELHVCL